MFCSNCGKELLGNFCANCGSPASVEPVEAVELSIEERSIITRNGKSLNLYEQYLVMGKNRSGFTAVLMSTFRMPHKEARVISDAFLEMIADLPNLTFLQRCDNQLKRDLRKSINANLEVHSEVKSEVISDTLAPKKKTSAGRIIAWVASVLLFFFGLIGLVAGDTVAAIAVIVLGLIFNPAISKTLSAKLNFFSKVWFKCLSVAVFLFVFGASIDLAPPKNSVSLPPSSVSSIPSSASSTPSSKPPVSDSSSSVSQPDPSKEDKKLKAIELDLQINAVVLSVEKNHNILLSVIDNAESMSLVDLYDTTKKILSAQRSYATSFYSLGDKAAKKYLSACNDYTINSCVVADSILKYMDKNEIKYLSDAKTSIEYSDTLVMNLIAERMAFLSSQGLSDDDIIVHFGSLEE